MTINENQFFHEATLRICGNLDIGTAMRRCLRYLQKILPVSQLRLHVYEKGLGSIRTVLSATPDGSKELDILCPLSGGIRDQIESPEATGALVINGTRGNSIVMRIVNRPELNPIAEFISQQFQESAVGSCLIMYLASDGLHFAVVVLATEGRDAYTEEHARLFSLLHDPFTIALSNALKHREVLRLRGGALANDSRYADPEPLRLSSDEIIGARTGLKRVMSMVDRVSHLSNPVLLLGETGVGKDVIANSIHYSSPRRDGPFVKVNCGAIPETLIDSELFGHEKGAYTDAVAQYRGCFERAHRGTIFLDEIAELPSAAQVRMLRVIQYKEIQRVGGSGLIPVDIRIVAATHRNLKELVKTGEFREDLWFRLNVFPIPIPPLRERKADIASLVNHFIRRKSKELRLPGLATLAPGAIDRLTRYDWPGNVRELENVIERALILSGPRPLTFDRFDLPSEREDVTPWVGKEQTWSLNEVVADYIRQVLEKTKGQINGPGGAAELLDVNPSTLRCKMNKLGIPYGRSR